jgi:CcmD family protein
VSRQWEFVIAAYTVTWVTLTAYAAYVWRRWRRAQREAGGVP